MNSSPHYAAEVPEEHEADHSSVSLAVSTVILALRHKKNSARPSLWLPLVRRLREPYKGQWALPGGPLQSQQSLEQAAGYTQPVLSPGTLSSCMRSVMFCVPRRRVRRASTARRFRRLGRIMSVWFRWFIGPRSRRLRFRRLACTKIFAGSR